MKIWQCGHKTKPMLRLRLPGAAKAQQQQQQQATEIHCTVRLLDHTELICFIQRDAKGRFLMDHVCNHLDLLERDYFGIRFVDPDKQRHWLDPKKSIVRQMKCHPPFTMCFRVKFYPQDPSRVREEITRYQLYLQLKRDVVHGRLLCSTSEAAWLGAYALQAELGDYNPLEHQDGYVSSMQLFPRLSQKLEARVVEIHRHELRSQTPAVAESNFLIKAHGLDTYAVDPHPCKDTSGTTVFLGFTPVGFVGFQGNKRVQLLKWMDVGKLKCEGKSFYVHGVQSGKKTVLTYHAPTPPACKHLWKCGVEHQAFYKFEKSCEIKTVLSSNLFFRGSRFRYRGRVAKEVMEASARIQRKSPEVQRSIGKSRNSLSFSQQSVSTSTTQQALSELPDCSFLQGLMALKADAHSTPMPGSSSKQDSGCVVDVGSRLGSALSGQTRAVTWSGPGCGRHLKSQSRAEVWPGGCVGLLEDREDVADGDQPLIIADLTYSPTFSTMPTPVEDTVTIDSIFACNNKYREPDTESTCEGSDFEPTSLLAMTDDDDDEGGGDCGGGGGGDHEQDVGWQGDRLELLGGAARRGAACLCGTARLLLALAASLGLLLLLLEAGLDAAPLREIRQTPEFQQLQREYLGPLRRWLSTRLQPSSPEVDY